MYLYFVSFTRTHLKLYISCLCTTIGKVYICASLHRLNFNFNLLRNLYFSLFFYYWKVKIAFLNECTFFIILKHKIVNMYILKCFHEWMKKLNVWIEKIMIKTFLSNPLKVNKFKFETNGTMPKQTAVYIRCV